MRKRKAEGLEGFYFVLFLFFNSFFFYLLSFIFYLLSFIFYLLSFSFFFFLFSFFFFLFSFFFFLFSFFFLLPSTHTPNPVQKKKRRKKAGNKEKSPLAPTLVFDCSFDSLMTQRVLFFFFSLFFSFPLFLFFLFFFFSFFLFFFFFLYISYFFLQEKQSMAQQLQLVYGRNRTAEFCFGLYFSRFHFFSPFPFLFYSSLALLLSLPLI